MTLPAQLVVLLDGERIGVVDRKRDGRLHFTYDDAWRRQPGATPLSTSMPLAVASHAHSVIEAFLWGLLPDNETVLQRWGRQFHVSARSPFGLLSTPIGEDCAGAVQLVTEDRVEHARSGGGVIWLSEDEVATQIGQLRTDRSAWLPAGDSGQFSLAGAQSKTALFYDEPNDRWGLPSGRMPTTHIIKLAIQGLDQHDLNEHLCLGTAQRLGLAAAQSTLRRFAGETVLCIRRYDRLAVDGQWRRVHQEDLCQALGVGPTTKYQNEGGPSPKQIATALRERVGSPRDQAEDAVWRFLDALAFNWIIAGTDAHAKNYSLLLSGSSVRLAPLYDLASVLPYGEHIERLRLAMKVGGEYRLHLIGRRHWLRMAADADVDEDRLVTRVSELAETLPDALAEACADETVRALDSALPMRLLSLVRARSGECLRLLR